MARDMHLHPAVICRALLFALGVSTCPLSAHAQAPVRDQFWLSGGVGIGSEEFGAGVAASWAHREHSLSLRSAATAGVFEDGYWDYGLLYGRNWRGTRVTASLAAGIGAADGEVCGGLFTACRDPAAVLGLPLEAQLRWAPTEVVGIGLYGFANINHLKNFVGLLAVLQIGRLR